MEILEKDMRFVTIWVILVSSSVPVDCLLKVSRAEKWNNTPNCRFLKKSYVCSDIPVSVPLNVTYVMVMGSQSLSLTDNFNDPTWGHVKRLDLTGTRVQVVADNSFITLNNLTELTLRLSKVLEFQSLAFKGLLLLKKLEMFDMCMLQSEVFSTLGRTVPALEVFTFIPNRQDITPTVRISSSAVNTFWRMKSANISKTFIETSAMTLIDIFLSTITTVNISRSTLMLFEQDTFDIYIKKILYKPDTGRPILKTLDLSGSKYPNGPFGIQSYSVNTAHMRQENSGRKPLNVTFPRYATLIENVYADDILHDDCIFHIEANYSESPFFCKTISMRRNNIMEITGHLVINFNNTIHTLDWSENKIQYISPESLSSLVHLKTAKFASNTLHKMQHRREFQHLFKMHRELEVLDLSDNNLSFIPFQMFDSNINIEILNLSFNSLTTVTFRLTNLRKMKLLELSGNQIRLIDGQYLTRLQQYMAAMIDRPGVITLDLDENPLTCACKSVPFIEWLAYVATMSHNKNSFRCIYEGKLQNIDTSAIDKSKYLCKREMVIIVSLTVSSVLFIGMVVVVSFSIRIYRRRKQINRLGRFLKEFSDQNTDGGFVFLAYASLDEDLVRNHLLLPLNETLKTRLGTNKDTVATGYNFRPGFRITEETFRLVQKSPVFMAVISSNFCRSEYCVAELHEACNQRKPSILIFKGEVDISEMSPYLREVFRRVVRAKMLVCDNGEVEIVPSVEKICDSMILLAMNENDSM